jgi:hypothetical protein
MVLKGQVLWQDAAAREATKVRAKQRTAVPLDRNKEPLCKCSTGFVCSIHRQTKALKPFRAGVAFLDEFEQVVYRVIDHVGPHEGWVSSEFLQKRWRVTHKEILQLARAYLIDAVMAAGSQVRFYRARDEAAVLRSDPVLRCALKRKHAVQGSGSDGVVAQAPSRARAPRRVDGRWEV